MPMWLLVMFQYKLVYCIFGTWLTYIILYKMLHFLTTSDIIVNIINNKKSQ